MSILGWLFGFEPKNPNQTVNCPRCMGSGREPSIDSEGNRSRSDGGVCPKCNGDGTLQRKKL
jgi:DnaJ-class molecular chaperone